MSRNNEFNANRQMAERRRTPRPMSRPMSRPEREIRQMRRYTWLVLACGAAALMFPVYVLAVMVFVK